MDHDEGRRRPLCASLAAPAVLTVASPSALGASSLQACLARLAGQPVSDATPVPTADQWLRRDVPVYRGRLKATGEEGSYYLCACDRLYYPIDPQAGGSAGRPATDFTGNRLEPTTTRAWGLVFLDAEGRSVGFGCRSGGGHAVTCSCRASLALAA